MGKVLQQYNSEFLSILDNLQMGTVCDNEVDFILKHCLDKMDDETRQQFQQVSINLVLTWKMVHMITYIYLDSFYTPLAKIKAILESPCRNGINNCIKESYMPLLNAICIGSVLLLLSNLIVEYNLMNGDIGILHDIVYTEHDRHNNQTALPAYVIVEFKDCSIPNDKKLWKNNIQLLFKFLS